MTSFALGTLADALSGLLPGPRPEAGADPGVLAPALLPPPDALRPVAAEAPLVRAVVDGGRAGRGSSAEWSPERLTCGASLERVAVVVAPGLADALRATVPDSAFDEPDALVRHREVVDAYVRLGPLTWHAGRASRAPRWRRAADRRLPVALLALYELEAGALVDVEGLAALCATTDRYGGDEPPMAQLEAELGAVVSDLVAAGVLAPRPGGAALAPLGRWYVRQCLLRAGFVAPLAGELTRARAAPLLRAAARWDPDVAARELHLWAEARGADAAVDEVAAAVRDDHDPALAATAPLAWSAASATWRGGVVHVDAGAAEEAEDDARRAVAAEHVRRLAQDPLLRPSALAWARDLHVAVEGVSQHDVLSVLALRAWGVLHRAGTEAMCAHLRDVLPHDGRARVVAALWRAPADTAGPVLEALLSDPDPLVAEAARLARRRAARGTPAT